MSSNFYLANMFIALLTVILAVMSVLQMNVQNMAVTLLIITNMLMLKNGVTAITLHARLVRMARNMSTYLDEAEREGNVGPSSYKRFMSKVKEES